MKPRRCTATASSGKRCQAPAARRRGRSTCSAHRHAYKACAADCGERTFKGPVCAECLVCRGCALAYEYGPGGKASKTPCPGCGVAPSWSDQRKVRT